MTRPDDTELLTEDHSRRLRQLEETLAAFIAWTAQSANSPISVSDAQRLLAMMADGE